ncbi:hypothetical protein [Allobacillus sp. SKP2-8]
MKRLKLSKPTMSLLRKIFRQVI